MRVSKIITGCMFTILILPSLSVAQGWRGIVPLHSTCEDVRRVLSTVKCESSTYYLEDEVVDIGFSQKPCHEKWPYERWNIPPGTVTGISIRPKREPQITELGVDIGKYKKVVDEYSTGGHIYYSEEEGVFITADAEGKVLRVAYLPAAKDYHLRCPGAPVKLSDVGKKSPDAALILDKYGNIDFNKESARLDNFARQLAQYGSKMQGYIIAYSGRRSRVGEAQARAERAKNYLINTHGVEAERITTVDGGYDEESTVELWISVRGTAAPVAAPTVHPAEVQIIKDGNARNNNRRSSRQRHKQHRLCQ